MDSQQRQEYDFFMRAAALFEQKAVQLSPLANSIAVAPMFRQAIDDAENARLWAERIAAGWLLKEETVPAKSLPPAEPPARYR